MRTNAAIGGSTNAVIHLLAIAGRMGIDLSLDDQDRCGRDIQTIVNLFPSGKYLMEDFFCACGLPIAIKLLGEAGVLHRDALTVSGGVVMLRGNLAPKGVVLKPSAATTSLLVHRDWAVVFEDIDDDKTRINDEALDIDETCVVVLKNCGPNGYPGMAEVCNTGPSPMLLRNGITDLVRISDARMSGAADGGGSVRG